MTNARRLMLVGKNGEALETTIQAALNQMRSRIVRQFPALQDEVALIEVMEEAGRRIAVKQQRDGPLANLHGYAWVTVRSVATSFMRRSAVRLMQQTLEHAASQQVLKSAPSATWTPQDIEQDILIQEILGRLTVDERQICLWKHAGFSSHEISNRLDRSVAAIDTAFSRAKEKLRKLLA